jgi:DNA adenine methylase
LKAVSKLLVNVKILEKDFEEVCNMAKKGDGIYLDPPYLPLSKTSNFTSYTKTRFNLEQHQRLAKIFKKLVRKRIRTVLTNSFSPMTLELYKGHDMDLISGLRNIGGPASYRNSVKEAVIFGGAKLQ